MIDLEERLTRVHDPDVRPLVQDAHRCYATGVPRAAVVLTRTAVCAGPIAKARVLAEDGEPDAKALAQKVEEAQRLGGDRDEKRRREGAGKTREVEREILDTALALELIDSSRHVRPDRLREDRHQSACAASRNGTPGSGQTRWATGKLQGLFEAHVERIGSRNRVPSSILGSNEVAALALADCPESREAFPALGKAFPGRSVNDKVPVIALVQGPG
ncbi:hypothetical protein [Kitasatospora sp. NPDC004272]